MTAEARTDFIQLAGGARNGLPQGGAEIGPLQENQAIADNSVHAESNWRRDFLGVCAFFGCIALVGLVAYLLTPADSHVGAGHGGLFNDTRLLRGLVGSEGPVLIDYTP